MSYASEIGRKLKYSDFHGPEKNEIRVLAPVVYPRVEHEVGVLFFDENGRRVSESETVSLRTQAEQSFRCKAGFPQADWESSTK
jgi:hypothetical protein